MSMDKAEEKCCDCNCDYLDQRIADAREDRMRIKKMMRVILAIMIDKKLVGEETAKAFMESKEVNAFMESETPLPENIDDIIRWAEAKPKFWIKKAIGKPGALRKQLGIKDGEKIPKSILNKIAKAEIGTKVSFRKKSITVTAQLKKRAVLALKLGKMKK